jgi:hypothetical protein
MPKKRNQAEERRYSHFTDQHGRSWGAVVDKAAGQPLGVIEPKFEAPYLPHQSFFTFDPNEPRFVIEYDAIIEQRKTRLKEWEDAGYTFALAEYGDKAVEVMQNPTPAFLRYVGPKPDPVEIPEAAKAGNKWVLGFSDAVPEWAKRFLPVLRPPTPDTTLAAYPDADDPKPKKAA